MLGNVVRMRAISRPNPDQDAAIGPLRSYRIVGVRAPGVDGTFASDVQVWMRYAQAVPMVFGPATGDRYQQFKARQARTATIF